MHLFHVFSSVHCLKTPWTIRVFFEVLVSGFAAQLVIGFRHTASTVPKTGMRLRVAGNTTSVHPVAYWFRPCSKYFTYIAHTRCVHVNTTLHVNSHMDARTHKQIHAHSNAFPVLRCHFGQAPRPAARPPNHQWDCRPLTPFEFLRYSTRNTLSITCPSFYGSCCSRTGHRQHCANLVHWIIINIIL